MYRNRSATLRVESGFATPSPASRKFTWRHWFLSYPGNSGGPLYVQLNGYYYPAGVYLGTLNGQSVVRGIDSSVTNLDHACRNPGRQRHQ